VFVCILENEPTGLSVKRLGDFHWLAKPANSDRKAAANTRLGGSNKSKFKIQRLLDGFRDLTKILLMNGSAIRPDFRE
jgi:hypothetical protein